MSIKSGPLPHWLCETSLQKIIESKLNRNCQVLSVKCDKGSNAGDHYLSEIVRLCVRIKEDGREQILPLIIKDENQGWVDFMEEVNAVEKEIEVYSELIPFANRVLAESVAPDCYYISQSNCLLFEDLAALGYKLRDRRQQMDFKHSKAALKSLAQFHAASVKLLEISPNSIKAAREESCFVESENTIICNLHKHTIKTVTRALRELDEAQEYIGFLEQFRKTFWKDSREAIVGNFDFKVLNHGDFWMTNIMFKYDQDEVAHSRLVDFQLTRYCTPCYDLHVFISTSVSSEVRDNHMDELLNEYVVTLNETLKAVGSSRTLTKSQLDKDMYSTRVFGILYGLSLAPVVLLDPANPIQLEGATKEEICGGFQNVDPYKDVCNNDLYLKHILSLLKYYKKINYF